MVINGDTILQGGATHIPLSGVTAYHLLEGSLALASTTPTSGFSTTLYTGNGTAQSITTGIDMDTQWGNDASETFGGLVWIKNRSITSFNLFHDTTRGFSKAISSNSTNADGTNNVMLNTVNGFSIANNDVAYNQNAATYASWNFQTTHRVTGTTNHGKAYTCHYNPFTGFTIVKYEGSGIAGHEIPHHLGRKLGFVINKQLNGTSPWLISSDLAFDLFFNTAAQEAGSNRATLTDNYVIDIGVSTSLNLSGGQYIMYGWANSYKDEANKLIGNYEIGVYQGTGAAGNKVKTKGKPAWVMFKRLDSTSNWWIVDNKRGNPEGYLLAPNIADVENTTYDFIDFVNDGFILDEIGGTNASGGQYLYMVVYDNDSGSGKSKYPKPSDNPTLNLTAIIPFANGVDVNGTKVSILNKNETVSGMTLTQGKNYVYAKNDGTYGVSAHRPRFNETDLVRSYAGESPAVYKPNENQWYNSNVGAELVTNGTFTSNTTGWTQGSAATISWEAGRMKFTSVSASGYGAYQDIVTLVGKKYTITANVAGGSMANYYLLIDSLEVKSWLSYTGAISYTFIANNTTTRIGFSSGTGTAGLTSYYDNISVFEADIVPSTPITESRNYLDAIVYADHNGNVEYVEQLPKTVYLDEIKANEYRGKNACTAWVNFDGTTTPPTIRDSYNVSSVVRANTGLYEIYFEEAMDKNSYTIAGSTNDNPGTDYGSTINYPISNKLLDSVRVFSSINTSIGTRNQGDISVQIFGGKN